MKIAIRVDASRQIGTGHVMRCLVLAKKLLHRGHRVVMLSRQLTGNLVIYSRQQGVNVTALYDINDTVLPDIGDYQHWLGVTQAKDAAECLDALGDFQPDWVVVDHYALDREWQSTMRSSGANILTIDDLANRQHDCNILLDQNPWPNFETRYHLVVPAKCIQLLGPKYALLRERFSELRQNPCTHIRNHLLAFFSGTDPSGESIKLLKACQQISSLPFNITIVYGMSNPRKDILLGEHIPHFVSLAESLPDFDSELETSRYTFGGAGVCAIERACLRIPGTLLSVAENQRLMAEHLASTGIYRYLGLSDTTTENSYINELKWLSEHWDTLPRRLPESDIDGQGVLRVVHVMEDFQ